ncbi:MAG: Calx-beta domain-containing protein [Planctomycetaceae bacterium]
MYQLDLELTDFPYLAIANSSGSEASEIAEFVVGMDSNATTLVTFDYSVVHGTTESEDFVTTNGSGSIAVGENQTTISLAIADDALVDTGESFQVSISNLSGANLADGMGNATIQDNDTAKLTVTIPVASMSEDDDSVSATVFRNTEDVSGSLVVSLGSDDSTEATVPATVTIPAGQSSTTFSLASVEDDLFDGTISVAISAAADGFVGGTETVDIVNSDDLRLDLVVESDSISESAGTTNATVSHNNADTTSAVVVAISISDESELSAPTTVTIPSGSSSFTFTLTGVDDPEVDGDQTATVSATSNAHTAGSIDVEVTDDDIIETSVLISSGSLFIQDIAGADSNDALTMQVSGDDLVITDTNHNILATNGVTQVAWNSVSVPISAITDTIFLDTLGGDDSISIGPISNSVNADVVVDGGEGTDTLDVDGAIDLPGTHLDLYAETISVNAAISTDGGFASFDAESNVQIGAAVNTEGGFIFVVADSDADTAGGLTITANGSLVSDGETIDIFAGSFDLSGSIDAGSGTVSLSASTTEDRLWLGSTDSHLMVTDTELDQISAELIRIGSSAAPVGIASSISPANSSNLRIDASTLITSHALNTIEVSTLTLITTDGIGTSAAPVGVNTNSLSMAISGDASAHVAETDTTELVVANSAGGTIQLTGGSFEILDETPTSLHFSGTATASPKNSTGLASVQGDLTFESNATFSIGIAGTTAGAATGGHGKLTAANSVTLDNAPTLTWSVLDGFVPTPGDTFVVIKNEGFNPVAGTFDGMEEGEQIENFLDSGLDAIVSYAAGDGNDIAITVQAPKVSLSLSHSVGTETDETQITVTASTTAAVSGDQTVAVSVSGSGIDGNDFSLSDTTITIPDGQTEGTVTLTISDDAYIEDVETLTVQLASPTDGMQLGESIQQDVEITSDDFAGFSWSTAALTVSETGTSQSISVVLDSQPIDDVVITANLDDETEAEIDLTRLTFSTENWNTPQTLTATGLDDSVADGGQLQSLVFAIDIDESDTDFTELSPKSANVFTSDDESATFSVVESHDRSRVLENGPTDTLLVSLDSQPLGAVFLTIVNGDTSEISLDVTTLEFTPENWDLQQVVTITAVNDSEEDGVSTSNVETRVDIESSHSAFQQAPISNIDVLAIDDDGAVSVSGDILRVDGTDEADAVLIQQSGDEVLISFNQEPFIFYEDEFDVVSVVGGSGDDIVEAEGIAAAISFNGGAGDDSILAGSGDDTLRGGGGNDTLRGSLGNEFINGGSGADSLRGESGDDTIEGQNGPDKVLGGNGNDSLSGGEGTDTVNAGSGNDAANGGSGDDSIIGGNGDDTLGAGSGNDTISGDSGDDVVQGGNGADVISGGGGADLLLGQNGADSIVGDDDRDVLFGGKGNDNLSGGSGNDILIAGYTTLDITALLTIVEEWDSARNYDQRVENVVGEGDGDRFNTAFLIGSASPNTQTVFDDERSDNLTGDGAYDMFFANIDLDDLPEDQLSRETVRTF